MDLIYKIGEVAFEKKFIRTSNDISLFTKIERLVIDSTFVEDFEDYFCLESHNGYIHLVNDKIVHGTYSVLWNETKSKIKGTDINTLLFYTDDDMKTIMSSDLELSEKYRKEAFLKLRKHKIKKVLDDDKN